MDVAAKYKEILDNPQLISLRKPIEMVRTRIYQLFERIDQNESPQRMKTIADLWQKFRPHAKRYAKSFPGGEFEKLFKQLDNEMEMAYHDYQSWEQIFRAFDLERKLNVDELRILEKMKGLMTAEDGYKLAAELMAAIASALDDPTIETRIRTAIFKRIQHGFTKVVGDADIIELDGGSGEA